jgi:resuscitation-promoting factor RpfB
VVTSGRDGVVLRQTPIGARRVKPHSVVTVVVANLVRPVAPPPSNCTPGYSPCLPPASDYDCAGGSGDGPRYSGLVRVTGYDIYDLDRDGDGYGCDT